MATFMSRGYDDGEESIYKLIPAPQHAPERPARHFSKYPGEVHPGDLEFGVTKKKQAHASFGLPNGMNANSTQRFLKTREKAPILPEPTIPSNPKTKLKADVPRRDEKPTMGLCSGKNFITSNAVDAIMSKPGKTPQEEFQWTSRPGFGKVPVYLRRNKALVAQEKNMFESYVRMQTEQMSANQAASVLSDSERSTLLHHLKKKWGSLNEAYQKGGLCVDSQPKKVRKEEMERQLAELERDIKMLERGETVLIVDDC